MISEETYDIFLDYTQLNENNCPLDFYNEFVTVYLSTKNVCRDFYKEDEILLDFDYKSMNMTDIVNTIIETRTYQNFDIDKLVLSLLYQLQKILLIVKFRYLINCKKVAKMSKKYNDLQKKRLFFKIIFSLA